MNKVMFISDLDGTLIQHNEKGQHVCEQSMAVIREQIANGMTFCIATGRHVADVICHEELPEVASYIIANNGGEVYKVVDGELEKIYQGKTVPVQVVKEMFAIAKEYAVYRTVATANSYICENGQENHLDFDIRSEEVTSIVEGMENGEFEATKISFVGHAKVVEDLRDVLVHYYSDFFDITISAEICLDINAKGITKGNGIEFLKRHLQVQADTIIGAVGDNGNDISMTTVTNYSFAMKNGSQELKNNVDYIVDTVGEAIETVVERLQEARKAV
ncbi:MAG: HAD-IIB family hydrolase [Bacillaceae bacterium]